jgi:hypothetical protein
MSEKHNFNINAFVGFIVWIIKTDLQVVGREGMGGIDLAQDGDRWRALRNAVMNLRIPQNLGNFLAR